MDTRKHFVKKMIIAFGQWIMGIISIVEFDLLYNVAKQHLTENDWMQIYQDCNAHKVC